MKKIIFIVCFLAHFLGLFAQKISLEGYVYESANRGFLNQVKIVILEYETGFIKAETFTDETGLFTAELEGGVEYQINATKNAFFAANARVKTTTTEKAFAKIQMDRKPGYIFDMTFAKAREGIETDGLTGVKLEIFNNTTNQEMLVIDSTRSQNAQFTMEQGNHYTFLIRKWGFFSKRIEAYVNVKGCILCIDGVDNVNPGVSDNLTRGFQMGTLLANIELQPLEVGRSIQIKNIYYDLGSAALRPESRKELEKLGKALKDNPYISVELASHTDARGEAMSNLQLSQRRAESVVDFLVRESKIDGRRLVAAGYGETRLVNRCNDENLANCNETEHQQNRRTELKVTSISRDEFFNKTLHTMIREEQMEVTLQKIEQEAQVIKEGDDMPEDLKRYIEEQKRKESGGGEERKEIKESGESKENKESKRNGNEEQKSEEKIIPSEIAAETAKVETNISPKKEGKILTENKIKPSTARKISPFVAGYTGFMIEVLTSDKEVAASNEIFTKFATLTLENREKGIAYLVGDFKTKTDAELFFNENVRKRYPKAKIIEYKAGKRSN